MTAVKDRTLRRSASRARRARSRLVGALPGPLARAAERLRGTDVPLFASALAFYALISLAPLLVVAMWATSMIIGDDRLQRLAQALDDSLPTGLGAGRALTTVAEQGAGLGASSVLVSLWPATAYGSALTRAFDHLTPGAGRPLRGLRGRALLFVAILPVSVVGVLGLSWLGSELLADGLLSRVAGFVLAVVFALGGGAGIAVLIYRVFPPQPLAWRGIARGAAVSAAGASMLALVLTLFVALGANFEDRYASSAVAGLVLLGLWLFGSNAFLLIGYEVAREGSTARGRRST